MNKAVKLPCFFLKDKKFVGGFKSSGVVSDDPVTYASIMSHKGADALVIFDLSDSDREHDEALTVLRNIIRNVDIPVYGAGNIKRLEDVKKLLYAGCRAAALNMAKAANVELIEEAGKRFSRDKIMVCVDANEQLLSSIDRIREFTSAAIVINDAEIDEYRDIKVYSIEPDPGRIRFDMGLDAAFAFSDLKTDDKGLIPVIVQDHKTDEVLMLAYMNKESYEKTLKTGLMNYYSRSRQELWLKGETSGHYQYVKALYLDCDNDTLLARVAQIGEACHTGNHSCFYREIAKKGTADTNPLHVFEDVYKVINDRKIHPKEGSYTNYLFDKGIDKILKKCGEEAAEIIIAAKNPDREEVKYEIADFLYHMMVLMAECGLDWEDITRELANR